MRIHPAAILAAALALGGCAADMAGTAAPGEVGAVPEEVAALAAPGQDLQSARLVPEDGCYWYEHAGPVEVTLLPLRTVDGRPICTGSGA